MKNLAKSEYANLVSLEYSYYQIKKKHDTHLNILAVTL